MSLDNLNLVELNAQEVVAIEGGSFMAHFKEFLKGLLGF
jgi:hypothetical protein